MSDQSLPATLSNGLERIILHHSYIRNKTTMIACQGHTNNSGSNGKGKTSALILIPIFYGKEPDSLVTKAADKKPFIDWYLPTTASFIAYEYQRVDGARCVFLYRNPSNHKLNYRFILSSYQDALGSDEMKERLRQGTPVTELFQLMKEKGIEQSNQIQSIVDYRSIIQQDEVLLRRGARQGNKTLRMEAQRFCLGSETSKMTDIHHLTNSLLRREKMMDSLRQMIAHTVLANYSGLEKPQVLSQVRIVDDIATVKMFQKNQQVLDRCLQSGQEFELTKQQLRDVSSSLLKSYESACCLVNHTQTVLGHYQKNISKVKEDKNNNLSTLSSEIFKKKGELKTTVDQLDYIHKKYNEYESASPSFSERIRQHDSLPELIKEKHQAENFYSLIREESDALIKEFELLVQEEKNQCKEKEDKNKDKITKVRTNIESLRQQFSEDMLAINEKYRVDCEVYIEERQAILDTLNDRFISLKTLLNSKQFTESEQAVLMGIQDEIDAVEFSLKDARSDYQSITQELNTVKASIDKLILSHSKLEEQQRKDHDTHAVLMKQLHPAENTLLAHLKAHDPQWADGIGKVINPALLDSKTLNPSFKGADAIDLIYGWSLDIEHLPQPKAAENEQITQARIEEITHTIKERERHIQEIESNIKSAEKSQTSLIEKLSKKSHELDTLEKKMESLRSHEKQKRLEFTKSMELRLSSQQEEYTKLGHEINSFKQFTKNHLSKMKDIFDTHKNELKGSSNTQINLLENRVQELQNGIEESIKLSKENIKSLTSLRDQRLADEGVDAKVLENAKQKLDFIKGKISEIQGWESEISAYQSFMRNEYSMVDALTKEEAKLESAIIYTESKLNEMDSYFTNLLNSYHKEENKLNEQKNSIKQIISTVHTSLSKDVVVKDINDPSFKNPGIVDDMDNLSDQFDSLINQYAQLTDTLTQDNTEYSHLIYSISKLRQSMKSDIDKVLSIIHRHQNSEIYSAWDKLQSRHPEEQQMNLSYQINDLRHLITHDLPQIQKAMLEHLHALGREVKNYHDNLSEISRQIKSSSRTLGQKINRNQLIGPIKDVEMILESRIEQMECWSDLSEFSKAWDEWFIQRDADELPSESLTQKLKDTIMSLSNARITDDRASLINLKISMKEGYTERPVMIGSDADLNNSSSNGLSLLAICILFLGMSRYLCPDRTVQLIWPIDELSTISVDYLSSLFQMMNEENIVMFSAFPDTEPSRLAFFRSKNMIDLETGVRTIDDTKCKERVSSIIEQYKQLKNAGEAS